MVVSGFLKEQGIEDIISDRKLEEDGKYECDQCDNNYTTKSSLYLHKQSKHEGLDMNVINVNTKQHARVIFLNINR